MKTAVKLSALSLLTSAILIGCGSSGNSTTDTSKTGYLVDAKVINADYDCIADNLMNQKTGSNGEFTCTNMSQVRFRLGELILGEISSLPSDGYVFPQDLVGVDRTENLLDENVTALAQFLQTLDSDGNVTNGITISDEIKASFTNSESFSATNLNNYLTTASIEENRVVTQTEARNHLRDTMHELISIVATDPGSVENGPGNGTQSGVLVDVNSYPIYTLSQELTDSIAYMGNEERLAHDVYMNLYNYHADNGVEIFQLQNIATTSESRHIETVQSIVNKYNLNENNLTNVTTPLADSTITVENMPSGQYDVASIQALYDILYAKGTTSQQDALEVGCMVEVTDINDLNKYITYAQNSSAPDIEEAFTALRDASYNHYWAFDKALKMIGVSDGCCTLGTIDGVNYCHSEYPSNSHGNSIN